jgi:hypothetical protein
MGLSLGMVAELSLPRRKFQEHLTKSTRPKHTDSMQTVTPSLSVSPSELLSALLHAEQMSALMLGQLFMAIQPPKPGLQRQT